MFRQLLIGLLAAITFNAFAAVDANRATQAELETVKGIGPALSGKILDARKTGEFKNWNDLVDRVGGVGPGNAARFSQAGLTVAGVAYDAGATTAAPAAPAKAKKEAKEPKDGKTAKASN
jgi:competence protein ComEA